MTITFGGISHATGALVYFLIVVLLARGFRRRLSDRVLLGACLLTSLWLATIALQQTLATPPFLYRFSLEIMRNGGWVVVLLVILGVRFRLEQSSGKSQYYLGVCLMGLLAFMFAGGIIREFFSDLPLSGNWLLVGQLAVSLGMLILLEQVWRNAEGYKRKNTRYLCLAIGTLFTYDFFLYSDALLFHKISPAIWDARGAINTLCAPLISLTMINTRKQPIDVQVSRQFVFHTSILIFAGIYLMIMAAGGYYINVAGGTWSEALLIIFFFSATLVLVLLGGSTRLRARLMVFISRHFFNYKYDYREEWLKASGLLTSPSNDRLESRVITVMARLVESQSGALWVKTDDNVFSRTAAINQPDAKFTDIDLDAELIEYMRKGDWVINLKEYQSDPTLYQLIEIPDCIWSAHKPWLLVPLFVASDLIGFVMIAEPVAKIELNWENYDLLKTIGRQAGSYLALANTQDKLSESKQFEAVNRTSAFLVHDLKTIIAQLSLLVKNAGKHKTNPIFVDDMIRTTEHAVKKINHLLLQIRNPAAQESVSEFDLVELLEEVITEQKNREPVPTYTGEEGMIHISADREQVKSVFVHMIQNAQDATQKSGEVLVSLKHSSGFVVIFIQDTGVGMSDEFIKGQLFKPFESTKGLTGMGIGVYQSREYLRKIGGTIDVTSEPGVGTCFTIKIPVTHSPEPTTQRPEAVTTDTSPSYAK